MKLKHRHWALALMVAALMQLALGAVLFRPHPINTRNQSAGVEIQLGAVLTGGSNTSAPATASPGVKPDQAPDAASARVLPSVPEPDIKKSDRLPAKQESNSGSPAVPVPAIKPNLKRRPVSNAATKTVRKPPVKRDRKPKPVNGKPAPKASITALKSGSRTPTKSKTAAGVHTKKRRSMDAATTNVQASNAVGGGDRTTTGTISSNYYGRLSAWLEKHKRYPRRAVQRRQQGVVRVTFKIDRQGNLLSREIIGSSGFRLLDEAADSLLLRASPMPGIPRQSKAEVLEITVPIKYALR